MEKQSSVLPVQVKLLPVQFTRALPVQVKYYPSSECETRATVQREYLERVIFFGKKESSLEKIRKICSIFMEKSTHDG